MGVIAPLGRTPKNVVFGYDVGKICTGCLVIYLLVLTKTVSVSKIGFAIYRLWVQVLAGQWVSLRSGLGQATYTFVPLVTKQYNLLPAKGGDRSLWLGK